MSTEQKFFICKHCGNLIGMINNAGVKMMCCGEPMEELTPNTTDASQEKHVPVIEVKGDTVTVKIGSAPHPMLEEHHITWIYLQTEQGGQRKELTVGGDPSATFALTDGDKPVAAFEYCNLHGLWKASI
ncbi:superoxide reductase [Hydrogenoanaerobacterium saccharovorans]|uniref:Superoxide reductase n=1 Tax=Hydrogenoanaerobacterium saccharovorans TaxID=474960 RepID=A0A1H7YRU6_9FIRM|nr:desulfoferrodoxin family protein [Hydrogenoanaerobacterium saccharovorans]RPF49097.1 superoxide reductase [Hydrogenoanaerobacterium saccharovorans]SEM47929.1 superoxide reductase [Hydrogenoanaerobacterium saccharovorans]